MGQGGHGSYDGIVYLLFPGNDNSILDANSNPVPFQFEGGNWTVGGDLPTAILPAGTSGHTHTFFTHGVGHLFGLADSQGIFRWNGTSWDSGCGDPLEIMSAQAWFASKSTPTRRRSDSRRVVIACVGELGEPRRWASTRLPLGATAGPVGTCSDQALRPHQAADPE